MRMTVLVALLLPATVYAQNMNLWPVDVRDEGTRLSKWRAYAADCRGAGVTCTSDGGVWTITVSGGGGGSTPDVTCAADQALSWNGTAWSCVSKISAAYAADASVTAQTATALAADPAACSAGQYASDISAAGVLTCGTPPGTYTLPGSTSAVTGGIRLTGDLGGTATSPTVVDDSHAHTGTTISALDTGDITTGTLSQARGGMGASSLTCGGGQYVTCNGTACSCSTPAGGASPLTTKGDIFTYSTVDTRLPVSTDGLCLKANSSTGTGLEWGTCAAGGSGLTFGEVQRLAFMAQ